MQKKDSHPFVASSTSSRSPSDLISNGKKAGALILDVKLGFFDVERVVKDVPLVEIIASKAQLSRSDYVKLGQSRGSQVSVVIDVGSNLTSVFDAQDMLKAGVHVKIPSSNQKFGVTDLRQLPTKGKFTVICDDRRLGVFDVDDVLKNKGSAIIYTSKATNFGITDLRSFSAKGHIEVIDDAKKLGTFDKQDIEKHHGIVRA